MHGDKWTFEGDTKTKIIDFSFDKHAFDQPITKADGAKNPVQNMQGSAVTKLPDLTAKAFQETNRRSPDGRSSKISHSISPHHAPVSEISYGPVVKKLEKPQKPPKLQTNLKPEKVDKSMQQDSSPSKRSIRTIAERESLEPSPITLYMDESYEAL